MFTTTNSIIRHGISAIALAAATVIALPTDAALAKDLGSQLRSQSLSVSNAVKAANRNANRAASAGRLSIDTSRLKGAADKGSLAKRAAKAVKNAAGKARDAGGLKGELASRLKGSLAKSGNTLATSGGKSAKDGLQASRTTTKVKTDSRIAKAVKSPQISDTAKAAIAKSLKNDGPPRVEEGPRTPFKGQAAETSNAKGIATTGAPGAAAAAVGKTDTSASNVASSTRGIADAGTKLGASKIEDLKDGGALDRSAIDQAGLQGQTAWGAAQAAAEAANPAGKGGAASLLDPAGLVSAANKEPQQPADPMAVGFGVNSNRQDPMDKVMPGHNSSGNPVVDALSAGGGNGGTRPSAPGSRGPGSWVMDCTGAQDCGDGKVIIEDNPDGGHTVTVKGPSTTQTVETNSDGIVTSDHAVNTRTGQEIDSGDMIGDRMHVSQETPWGTRAIVYSGNKTSGGMLVRGTTIHVRRTRTHGSTIKPVEGDEPNFSTGGNKGVISAITREKNGQPNPSDRDATGPYSGTGVDRPDPNHDPNAPDCRMADCNNDRFGDTASLSTAGSSAMDAIRLHNDQIDHGSPH